MVWLKLILACVPGILASIALGLWIRRERGRNPYFVRMRPPDAWGTRFDIVDGRTSEVVGFDWETVARQRCAAMNREVMRKG